MVCFKEIVDQVYAFPDVGPGTTHRNYWKPEFSSRRGQPLYRLELSENGTGCFSREKNVGQRPDPQKVITLIIPEISI